MKIPFNNIKRALVQVVYDVVQYRQLQKEIAKEKREAQCKMKKEQEMQRLRESVSGPDSIRALEIWMLVMSYSPNSGISQIYATIAQGWDSTNYLSFKYRTKDDLIEALDRTHWDGALQLLSKDCDKNYSGESPPPWPNYWPFQPSPSAKLGGCPSSRPFVSDCFYYYLDASKKRFFLSTGMTADALSAYINGKLEMQEQKRELRTKK
jgi:hypothetical protein